MKTKPKNQKGFTLIEVMMVTAILGILVAVSVPEYLRFQSLSRRSEAYSVIHAFHNAEMSYYADREEYFFSPFALQKYFYFDSVPDTYFIALMGASAGFENSGYILYLRGNIDTDPNLDGLIRLHGNPGPMGSPYQDGIQIVDNDITN